MELHAQQIQQNMQVVQQRIANAARAAHRAEADVRLVVVTKAQPAEVIRAAVAAGAGILGENYPQETVEKMQTLGPLAGVEWHMIGHLQSRKASLVTANFDLLHSLDSLRLAQKLNRLVIENPMQRPKPFPVLLECNVSGEASKFGWPTWDRAGWDALRAEVDELMQLPGLALRGLMTMPPLQTNPELVRPYFARMRDLAAFLASAFGTEAFGELSMGTSADYETAVSEGATLVRIGTAIVGERPAK